MIELVLNCGKWEFFMFDRNVFVLNFLKFWVLIYFGLWFGILILWMVKIRLWLFIDREYILEYIIFFLLFVIKRLIRVEVLFVILVGLFIICVNWYVLIILMSCVVYEFLEFCRRL